MNLLQKISDFFIKPADEVIIKEDELVVTSAIDPSKIAEDQKAKDLEALNKLDNKIASTQDTIVANQIVTEEYSDGLTIKNPFEGE
jgi:hypothetical protein